METVVKCEKVKDWNGKPIYSIGLSDGQGGESFAQEIPIGTPVSELTITPNGNYAPKIKWNKPGGGGGSGFQKQRSGNESFALSYAKDLAVAYVGKGNNVAPEKVIEWADKFYSWLEKKKGTPQQSAPVVLASQLQSKPAAVKEDDLPF
jgi:hypothetical protein